jgi:hypothetical protein
MAEIEVAHLLSRGDRREEIFRDDLDRKSFLAALGVACQKSGWQVPLLRSLNACFVLVAMNISAPMELKLYKAIFVCRTLLAGSLPSNPSGTDETLGIYYPQELNVVHIQYEKVREAVVTVASAVPGKLLARRWPMCGHAASWHDLLGESVRPLAAAR